MCVLLIVIPGLLRLASHNPSFFLPPERRAVKSEREQKDRIAEKRKTRRDDGEKRKRDMREEGGGGK